MKLNMENVKTINNLGFDKEKTEKLIEGLKQDGVEVGIEDLSSYIRKQGLIVKVHIGRRRNYVEVSPKLFGVDIANEGEDLREFFKEHIKMGKMSFIPDSYEKPLINIESAIRMKKNRNSIGYEDSFMTLPSYEEFAKDFKEKQAEYFEQRDYILSKWDELIADFQKRLTLSLDELNSVDKGVIFADIISKIPTKEEYANSFYMSISAKAFPVTENLDVFSEDIQTQIKEGLTQETITTLYEVIGNTLNDAFQCVNRVLISIGKSEKVAPKTRSGLSDAVTRIRQKNIFNNAKIEEIAQTINAMTNLKADEIAEPAELALAKVYGYAKEIGVEQEIKFAECVMSPQILLGIFEMVTFSEEVPIMQKLA